MSTSEMRAAVLLGCATVLASCDRKGADMLPQPVEDFPVILEIGDLRVLGRNEVQMLAQFPVPASHQGEDGLAQWPSVLTSQALADAGVPDIYRNDLETFDNVYDWCALEDEDGQLNCYYGQVGPPEAGKRGGGTFTFTVPDVVADTYSLDLSNVPGIEGDGIAQVYIDENSPQALKDEVRVDTVCVVVDSETLFWNHAISPDPADRPWILSYPDEQQDDGDLDLFGGMTSYYTGSPGIELGDFRGFYTDSLGRQIEIEFDECFREALAGDGFEAHAGRGAVDYCELDVEGRNGIEFTMLLDTFSVPLNDGALSFGAMVFNGPCATTTIDTDLGRDLTPNECMLPAESLAPDKGSMSPKVCVEAFEQAACASELFYASEPDSIPPMQEFCCAHEGYDLGLCNEDDRPDDACQQFQTTYGALSGTGDARSGYCSVFPERCCEYYEPGISDRYYANSW